MSESSLSQTSKMRMIATDVIHNQAELCAVRMDGFRENLRELTVKLDKIADTVQTLSTDVTVLKTRWQLFAISGAIIGLVGTIGGILVAIFK